MRTGPGFTSWISIETVMSSEGLNACITQSCLAMISPFRAEPFRKSKLVSTVLVNFIEVGYSWTQIWRAISKDRFKILFNVIISSERLLLLLLLFLQRIYQMNIIFIAMFSSRPHRGIIKFWSRSVIIQWSMDLRMQ